jgi:hypothetical protein
VRSLHAAGLFIIFLTMTTGSAHAYLDPGTGSILLQGIIGSIAAASFIGRSYITRAATWIRKRVQPRGADHEGKHEV